MVRAAARRGPRGSTSEGAGTGVLLTWVAWGTGRWVSGERDRAWSTTRSRSTARRRVSSVLTGAMLDGPGPADEPIQGVRRGPVMPRPPRRVRRRRRPCAAGRSPGARCARAASSTRTVGVRRMSSRRTRSRCDSASISTWRTPSTWLLTSSRTRRVARHGWQKAEENCTSVARSPSGPPRSPASSGASVTADGRLGQPVPRAPQPQPQRGGEHQGSRDREHCCHGRLQRGGRRRTIPAAGRPAAGRSPDEEPAQDVRDGGGQCLGQARLHQDVRTRRPADEDSRGPRASPPAAAATATAAVAGRSVSAARTSAATADTPTAAGSSQAGPASRRRTAPAPPTSPAATAAAATSGAAGVGGLDREVGARGDGDRAQRDGGRQRGGEALPAVAPHQLLRRARPAPTARARPAGARAAGRPRRASTSPSAASPAAAATSRPRAAARDVEGAVPQHDHRRLRRDDGDEQRRGPRRGAEHQRGREAEGGRRGEGRRHRGIVPGAARPATRADGSAPGEGREHLDRRALVEPGRTGRCARRRRGSWPPTGPGRAPGRELASAAPRTSPSVAPS